MTRNTLLFLIVAGIGLSCAKRPATFYFKGYSEAESLYNKGEYQKAIEQYQAYIDQNPDGNLAVISQYYIAKSHAALGHVEEAKGLYQKIVKEHPNGVWANFAETQLKDLEQGKK